MKNHKKNRGDVIDLFELSFETEDGSRFGWLKSMEKNHEEQETRYLSTKETPGGLKDEDR